MIKPLILSIITQLIFIFGHTSQLPFTNNTSYLFDKSLTFISMQRNLKHSTLFLLLPVIARIACTDTINERQNDDADCTAQGWKQECNVSGLYPNGKCCNNGVT